MRQHAEMRWAGFEWAFADGGRQADQRKISDDRVWLDTLQGFWYALNGPVTELPTAGQTIWTLQ